MEHAFGLRPAFPVGVEEELLLIDPDTLGLAHRASELLPHVDGAHVKPDVYEALVECATPICRTAGEAAGELRELRGALRRAGATLAGAGLHPTAAFGDVIHVPVQRYELIHRSMRGLLERTPTCALHVHVGMPDPETAVAACNRLRSHLPLLQALAAHSPFWHGHDAGFATARAQLFRGFPRAVIPRPFDGWDDYASAVECWVAAGELPDYTYLWWDIRPHPQLGTVEVRAMDAQARTAAAEGLTALVHALAAACADGEGEVEGSEALTESSFRAGRDGLAATLWWRGGMRPVAEVAQDALALAQSYAGDVGAADALDEVRRVLREGNGADRMRAAHGRGGLPAVVESIVADAYG